MKESQFALGYMPHRLWGSILQAQILEKDPGREFYTPKEYVQNDPDTQAYRRLTPMQKELIQLVDSYSDRNLHKLFSRKKTVKEFQDTVDNQAIREHVRPYIEKYLYAALEIARDNRVPVFIKDKSNRNVFPEDFVILDRVPAEPVFSFNYSEGLSYALNLIHRGKRIILNRGYVEIISNRPALVIVEKTLYFINEIDGKKLKPFLVKEQLVIPQEMEKKYFSTFVRNTLRDFDTRYKGFVVRQIEASRKAEITLEMGLNNWPVWILAFHYNQFVIHHDDKLKRFVIYRGDGTVHEFERFDRDPDWEDFAINTLKELGLKSRDDRNFYLNENLHKAIGFVNEVGDLLSEAGIQLRHRLNKPYFLGKIELDLESDEKEDWFDVRATVRLGTYTVSFLLLKEHILQGIREYELPGGEVAVLPEEWFARYKSMFEFGKLKGERIQIHKQHFSMMDDSVRAFHSETLDRLEKLTEAESIPALQIPSGLRADLRAYQKEGYTWLCFLQQYGFGGCLADDMGLGKTLQAIAVLLRSKEDLGSKPKTGDCTLPGGQLSLFGEGVEKHTSLVVVPASLLHNWISECCRFAPGLKIYAYMGNQRNRELTNFSYYDIVLSTYHTVRQDIEGLSTYLFHYVILDESQMIKNPSSKLYHAITELRSDHRIVLTGTPIENSLTDLWSQINFVNPGLLGSLSFFKRSFVQPIERNKDEDREEKLKELISPFILRRTKQEVARELPPVVEQIRYCSMTDAQRRVYEEEKSLARNSILENLGEVGVENSSIMVLQALTRLRQIANHPAMVEELGEIDSGKFSEVCRDVESIVSEGHQVLMFSSFVKHLDLFKEAFDSTGIRYAYLTGSQNQKQRKEAVETFQKKGNYPVFLISLKAGGVGLNLTAADYVFILDPWWNPAAEMQALSRAHRIGQDKNVFVYRFISENSIEEKILRLQERKRELAESFVTSSNPLRGLSEKEVLELFS
ncbi:MAG: DEAD/DEAH box helicase [Bacteroidota bacterium]